MTSSRPLPQDTAVYIKAFHSRPGSKEMGWKGYLGPMPELCLPQVDRILQKLLSTPYHGVRLRRRFRKRGSQNNASSLNIGGSPFHRHKFRVILYNCDTSRSPAPALKCLPPRTYFSAVSSLHRSFADLINCGARSIEVLFERWHS